ncbi:MAG: PD-(D/E)XK nuclease family protein, partial [Erysipelotrichaceae bacterium]|nr:PD-(D/E)XK nuclease family protein [Erysipelotrichaceae bacterium]
SKKNENLLNVYSAYRKVIGSRKDNIDIIRQALEQTYDLKVEFIKLEEFPLLPMEKALLDTLSGNKTRNMSLAELFGIEKKAYENISFIKAYGNSNEVGDALNYIFENDINLDDCVIAVSDTNKFNQLLLEYGQKYSLDMTFANGISINNTNPARLLRLYYAWDKVNFHGVDSLLAMMYSSCFDMEKLKASFPEEIKYQTIKNTIDRAGQLQLQPDAAYNKKKSEDFISLVENWEQERLDETVLRVLSEELARSCTDFIQEYAVIRDEKDEEALRTITYAIDGYLAYCPDGSYVDILNNILSKNVGRSVSRTGALVITDIRGALSACRKHLFVIGLSANNYPGTVRENYLLLDDDMKLYGEDVPVSKTIIERKKKDLNALLTLYSSLDAEIRLSYSSYDITGIKVENASSVLYEIYKKMYPDGTIDEYEKLLKGSETTYLQNKLSVSHQVLNALPSGGVISALPEGDVVNVPYDGKRAFSPSALEKFFTCRKRFYLSSILGIEEPDPDDPLVVIDARDMGTLVHSAMEYLGKNKGIDEKEFTEYANSLFDEFLKRRTPDSVETAEKARKEFLKMAVNGFRSDPKLNVFIDAEEEESVRHEPSGIIIYGKPDKVEQDENGRYLIVDYKTKKKIEHDEDDINTCLQVVLYAYMIKHRAKDPKDIAYCTYRYLRSSKEINCKYNAGMEKLLEAKMKEVKDALDSGYFPCTDDKDNCGYCKFATICGKKQESEGSENE